MKEYRIVINKYDGRGEWTFETHEDMFKAMMSLGSIKVWIEKGKAWIEEREVSAWHDTTFEVKAYE